MIRSRSFLVRASSLWPPHMSSPQRGLDQGIVGLNARRHSLPGFVRAPDEKRVCCSHCADAQHGWGKVSSASRPPKEFSMKGFLKLVTAVLLFSTTLVLANTTHATATIASRVSQHRTPFVPFLHHPSPRQPAPRHCYDRLTSL